MKCPVCQEITFVVEYQDVEIDLCPTCNGIWLDHGELELLLGPETAINSVPAESNEDLRRCPLCPKKMDKVNIGPGRRVLIDTCPDGCGLWFDSNELSELTHDLKNEGWHVQPEVREFLSGMFPD